MRHSVFALEICCPLEPRSPFRQRLGQLIVGHPEAASFQQRSAFYGEVSAALISAAPTFEYGCWDFFDDDDVARPKYQEWCNGLLGEEGVRKTPSSDPSQGPYRDPSLRRYMTFTMAFLLVNGSNSERTLAARCDIHQQNLWRRDVFVSLIQGVSYLNFASVRSDVIYMIPGADEYGLTPDDLGTPKFEYLRPLR